MVVAEGIQIHVISRDEIPVKLNSKDRMIAELEEVLRGMEVGDARKMILKNTSKFRVQTLEKRLRAAADILGTPLVVTKDDKNIYFHRPQVEVPTPNVDKPAPAVVGDVKRKPGRPKKVVAAAA